jgi:hypothetical protein
MEEVQEDEEEKKTLDAEHRIVSTGEILLAGRRSGCYFLPEQQHRTVVKCAGSLSRFVVTRPTSPSRLYYDYGPPPPPNFTSRKNK